MWPTAVIIHQYLFCAVYYNSIR